MRLLILFIVGLPSDNIYSVDAVPILQTEYTSVKSAVFLVWVSETKQKKLSIQPEPAPLLFVSQYVSCTYSI